MDDACLQEYTSSKKLNNTEECVGNDEELKYLCEQMYKKSSHTLHVRSKEASTTAFMTKQ